MFWGCFVGSRVNDQYRLRLVQNQQLQQDSASTCRILVCTKLVRGSSNSKIMTQNIRPRYGRLTLGKKQNKMVSLKNKNRVAGLFYFKLTGQKNKRKATRKCHTFVGTSKTGLRRTFRRIFDFHCRGNCHKLSYLPKVDALMNKRFRKHFDL